MKHKRLFAAIAVGLLLLGFILPIVAHGADIDAEIADMIECANRANEITTICSIVLCIAGVAVVAIYAADAAASRKRNERVQKLIDEVDAKLKGDGEDAT